MRITEIFGYLLNALYNVFNNYGIAIIIFSIILRIILIPITIKQQKSMKKSAELQEEMKEISKKYKNNPEKLNQETIELYKREKMSPFSGCLSSIVQLLIILAVFWLVSQPLTYMKRLNKVNYDANTDKSVVDYYKDKLKEENENQKTTYSEIAIIEKYGSTDERVSLNMNFLGLDLSKVPSNNLSDWRVYIIPLLYVVSSVISIKLTTNMANKKEENKKVTEGENSEPDELESMQAMNKNMTYMMPIMSVFIAFIAPLGLALYWLISNVLMIIEKIIIDKIINHKEEKQDA